MDKRLFPTKQMDAEESHVYWLSGSLKDKVDGDRINQKLDTFDTLKSQSMGKSLTFEQSVFETIDIHRKHKCKDPICEIHLWKARHQLDMALLKMKQVQSDLDQALKKQQEVPQPSEIEATA